MSNIIKSDAEYIIKNAIRASLPDEAVKNALKGRTFPGRVILVSAGKAAWQMAAAALECLGDVSRGIVITKYGHSKGSLEGIEIYEAAHPVPDENGIKACDAAINMISALNENDTVLFLLSGGGSALFEKPLIPLQELQAITDALLRSGADINEINTIRKRLSAVKGGRFAELCKPAKVLTLILSDVLGNEPSAVASGPSVPDITTSAQATAIAEKYNLPLSENSRSLLQAETPKSLDNSEAVIIGSVHLLCQAAKEAAAELGYEPILVSESITCEARDAGHMLAELARNARNSDKNTALILGGETVVHVTGNGKGGRNQEIALSAAPLIEGLTEIGIFSIGSDGTDGPTDAAGAYCDGMTTEKLRRANIDYDHIMADNDAYTALKTIDSLIITGPTGTNVNDVSIALVQSRKD